MKTLNEIKEKVEDIEQALNLTKGYNPYLEDEVSMFVEFLKSMDNIEATFLANAIQIKKIARLKLILENLKKKFFKEQISLETFDKRYESICKELVA